MGWDVGFGWLGCLHPVQASYQAIAADQMLHRLLVSCRQQPQPQQQGGGFGAFGAALVAPGSAFSAFGAAAAPAQPAAAAGSPGGGATPVDDPDAAAWAAAAFEKGKIPESAPPAVYCR